jgi:universal stress protein A
MKVKPTKQPGGRRGVVVELGPRESELPGAVSGKEPVNLPVFKLKHILVPVDFSECSRKALAYAVPFARQFGASITLLYVLQPFVPVSDMVPLDMESIDLRMRETGERELKALQASIDPEVASTAVMRIGNPHLEIARAARELEVDVIVLSTHGRTGLSHVLMGSTAERVVRHANCPVLVLREQEHEFIET